MKKVFIAGLVIAGLLASWECNKSEPVKPPATETTKTEQPAATAVSPTATAAVEVKGEVKPAVLSLTITAVSPTATATVEVKAEVAPAVSPTATATVEVKGEVKPAAPVSPTVTATVEVKLEILPAVLPHTITDAEVGLKAVCPVMKTPVTVNKNTLSAEYKGKVYYFCCGDCPGQFKSNPEKFVTTTETEKK